MKDIIALEKEIFNSYIPDRKVRQIVAKIKKATPNAFTSYQVEKRGADEWNANYLNELHNLFMCGAQSEEMLIYMAKVSRKVHFKKCVATIIAAIGLIVAIAIVIVFLVKSFER